MSPEAVMNPPLSTLVLDAIRHNCEISDARDHGIYSMCTMILRLRNLYKWENGMQPWQEPEPPALLDWIEAKENQWEEIGAKEYRNLQIGDSSFEPFATDRINELLNGSGLFYGAGYGRAMKSVFFLGEIQEQSEVRDIPLVVIGHEKIREMAGALAFIQDGKIIVRRELIRYFLWDQIQDMQGARRTSFYYALQQYGLYRDDKLDFRRLIAAFERIVDSELDIFIYHELGETLESEFDSELNRSFLARFPGSVIEFVCRTIKDLLADTHPDGLLAYLIGEQRQSGLGFYVGFLDGLREKLFPELLVAWKAFLLDENWHHIDQARQENRLKLLNFARTIRDIAEAGAELADSAVQHRFYDEILRPLGLDIPEE